MSAARKPRGELEALLQRGFRYALSLTHDEDRARDLLQDAWTAMLARDAPRHAGYLLRSIRNRFLDLERRRRLVAIEPLDALAEGEADQLAFLDHAHVRLDRIALERALAALRPPEREVLFLAAVEGHTVREIAAMTERPVGTVSSLAQRARHKLRRFFETADQARTAS